MVSPTIYFSLLSFLLIFYILISTYTVSFTLPLFGYFFPKKTSFFFLVFFALLYVIALCYWAVYSLIDLAASALVEGFAVLPYIDEAFSAKVVEHSVIPVQDESCVSLPSPSENSSFVLGLKNYFIAKIDQSVLAKYNEIPSPKPEFTEVVKGSLRTVDSEVYHTFTSQKQLQDHYKGSSFEVETIGGSFTDQQGNKGLLINPQKVYETVKNLPGSVVEETGFFNRQIERAKSTVLTYLDYDKDLYLVEKKPSGIPFIPSVVITEENEIIIKESLSPASPDQRIQDAF